MEQKQNNTISTTEKFIFLTILISSVTIYLQVSGYTWPWLDRIDFVTTVIFLVEMIAKHRLLGIKGYWSDGWNRMDGTLVLLSIPSLVAFFVPTAGASLNVLLTLRLLRALRFFRFIHFFESGIKQMANGFTRAIKASRSVLAAFSIIIAVFGIINCSLFGHASPEHFGTPMRSIYSVFQLFTIEGWYDIPASICPLEDNSVIAAFIRIYFSALLIGGGIIGMSFINSVFVDAMMEDNNDELIERIDNLEAKIDKLLEEKQSSNK